VNNLSRRVGQGIGSTYGVNSLISIARSQEGYSVPGRNNWTRYGFSLEDMFPSVYETEIFPDIWLAKLFIYYRGGFDEALAGGGMDSIVTVEQRPEIYIRSLWPIICTGSFISRTT